MSVIGCLVLDFDIEFVRFLYVKDKAYETLNLCYREIYPLVWIYFSNYKSTKNIRVGNKKSNF